ncbi:hypothetical protein [Sandaracinus amylolyticus]|uniref:Uncharacterized protein n=1 Tax=Sandaracinus amylolyticus TaxID=927083 RepID=A0A0F6WAU5_9BACT|nr:hypothetical protein [Sandaracinus amylolyticus]AKF11740.1 hypothetical protein DB32_008889 [Sandaracinus amylolyticus]
MPIPTQRVVRTDLLFALDARVSPALGCRAEVQAIASTTRGV